MKKFKHTLAKLSRTGTLIGPEVSENSSQLDPRFACKRNLSGKTETVISEHSSGVAYHPYAGKNFTTTIIYFSFKGAKDISIKSVYKLKALPLPT